jgi:hypothetical protein
VLLDQLAAISEEAARIRAYLDLAGHGSEHDGPLRAILHMRGDIAGERRAGHAAAAGTSVDLRLVLGHLQPRLRHLEHLPLLHPRGHGRRQRGLFRQSVC